MAILTLNIRNPLQSIPFYIGTALQQQWQQWIASVPVRRVFWIVDEIIAQKQAQWLDSYRQQSRSGQTIVVRSGEEQKSRQMRDFLEDTLLEAGINRQSLIGIIGGGVLGDLGGFVAASLHRGIPYVLFPTTLLAQVDSCMGGKVGINHPKGKNLLGAFYHPQAVFVDVSVLATLPQQQMLNGLAEVLKYAVLFDPALLQLLQQRSKALLDREPQMLEVIVHRSLQWKRTVVEQDAQDHGFRSVLNFGHTVGHALERTFDYTIPHGFAVLVGMLVELWLSVQCCGYPVDRYHQFCQVVQQYPYSALLPLLQADPHQVWQWMQYDKKADATVRFSLLKAPESPVLFYPVSQSQFLEAWEYVQNLPFLLGRP